MMNLFKKVKLISIMVIVFLLIVYKSLFVGMMSHVVSFFQKQENPLEAEVKILKEKVNYLENEYTLATDLLPYAKYNYVLARMSYRASYDVHDIYINVGNKEKVQVNYPLFNQHGLVGIIKKVHDGYSEATLLTGIDNLSVRIQDAYGTLTGYENGLFVLENISNYDVIHLNDEVYTSTLGVITESIPIGLVYKIDDGDISKKVYVKSNVNFQNISYVFVIGDV